MPGCNACDSGCQLCDSCQSCNSCQSCDQNCNGSGCNTKQNFCATSQYVGNFSFNQSLTRNSDFLTRINWNRLITYINNAYSKGSYYLVDNAKSGVGISNPGTSGTISGLPYEDSNEFMTAEMFNAVAAALGNLGSIGPSRRVTGGPSGDIVYGSYFQELETYAKQLKYKETQCNNCNVGCNVQCNTCLTCNEENCNSCDQGCQYHTYQECCYCELYCEYQCQTQCQICEICVTEDTTDGGDTTPTDPTDPDFTETPFG